MALPAGGEYRKAQEYVIELPLYPHFSRHYEQQPGYSDVPT